MEERTFAVPGEFVARRNREGEFDGICDEPEGTGLCPEGSDPDDCFGGNETGFEEDGGIDDGGGECPYPGDGECDEPEGTGICAEGTDPLDCT